MTATIEAGDDHADPQLELVLALGRRARKAPNVGAWQPPSTSAPTINVSGTPNRRGKCRLEEGPL